MKRSHPGTIITLWKPSGIAPTIESRINIFPRP